MVQTFSTSNTTLHLHNFQLHCSSEWSCLIFTVNYVRHSLRMTRNCKSNIQVKRTILLSGPDTSCTCQMEKNRKRMYRHKVTCSWCKKEIDSDYKQEHSKRSHGDDQSMKFHVVVDPKQKNISFAMQPKLSTNLYSTYACQQRNFTSWFQTRHRWNHDCNRRQGNTCWQRNFWSNPEWQTQYKDDPWNLNEYSEEKSESEAAELQEEENIEDEMFAACTTTN